MMKNLLAQSQQNIGTPVSGLGPYATGGFNPASSFALILSRIIGLLTIVAGIFFMFLLISGGIAWMSAGGDKGKLASARSNMVNGAVGLAIVVAGIFIVQIVAGIIGIGDILNPVSLLQQIMP